MLGIPLQIEQPVFADGFVNDAEKTVNIYASVADFSYGAKNYHGAKVRLHTINDSLKVDAQIRQGKWEITDRAST